LIADGEPAKRIKNAKCGIAVSPSDTQNLLPTFKQLACDAELRREYGEQGRAAAETTYNRDHIAAMLDRVLRDVLPASRDI